MHKKITRESAVVPGPLRPRFRDAARERRVDFDRINRAAVPALLAILSRWLPGGRVVGREYVALNPTRADKRLGSFKVVVSGPRAGCWADFATGDKGGDPVSLAAYLFDLSQVQAARSIADMLGVRDDR